MEKDEENYGRAYAFFDCNAPKEELEKKLPSIREEVQASSSLELLLKEVKDFKRDPQVDPDLRDFIQSCELKYVLEAKNPHTSTEDVGVDLVAIMNQVYQLYGEDKPFYGEIVGKNKYGEYVFWEDD
jgi:hypothetical protein